MLFPRVLSSRLSYQTKTAHVAVPMEFPLIGGCKYVNILKLSSSYVKIIISPEFVISSTELGGN